MRLRPIILLASLATVLTIAPIARAGWGNEICRSTGLGWSDGYHSRTACPPKGSLAFCHPWGPSYGNYSGSVIEHQQWQPSHPSPAPALPSPVPTLETRAKPGWTLIR